MTEFDMLNGRITVVTVTLLVLGVSVFGAGAASPASASEAAQWYVDARLGEADVAANLGSRHIKRFDSTDTTRSLGIGYRITDYVALELGLHDFGEAQGFGSPCPDNVDACIERFALETLGLCVEGTECTEVLAPLSADLTGFSLAVVPRWPVTDRVALFGKLGWIDWEADISGLFFGGTRETFSDGELLAGAGVRYDLESGLGVLLEYEQFDLDLDRFSLGLGWAF
ncbi:MAG: outer membrane beta-barrel protein [bacterium]|nr:outer membrane beta-barrel protein [bacterium]